MSAFYRIIFGATLALTVAPTLSAQERIERLFGNDGEQVFGVEMVAIGDADGDGIQELAVASYGAGQIERNGSVHLFSGERRILLHSWEGPNERDLLGTALAAAGDVDGDGLPDLIAGAPQYFARDPLAGYVLVISSVSGEVIHRIEPTRPLRRFDDASRFGEYVAGPGDVNGDGHADIAIGAWLADRTSDEGGNGAVFVYSGADGALLWETYGKPHSYFGRPVRAIDDVDRDGVGDILAGAWGEEHGDADGAIHVLSGRTGEFIRSYYGEPWSNGTMHKDVVAVGDLDGDGGPEVALSGKFWDTRAGIAFIDILSLRDGRFLHRMRFPADSPDYGLRLFAGGDLDFDGCDDLLVMTRREAIDAISLKHGFRLYRIAGPEGAYMAFGFAMATLGDLEGDGSPEWCAGAPGYWNAPVPGQVHVYSGWSGARLEAGTPITPQGFARVEVSRMSANGTATLYAGRSIDPGPVPECNNFWIKVGAPRAIRTIALDENGAATEWLRIPRLARGREWFLQAADLGECIATNVVTRFFPD